MTRLIVALDGDILEMQRLARRLSRETVVRFFKLGPSSLLQPGFHATVDVILDNCNADLFLDLKAYDTRDSVTNIVKRAFDLGARFVTVHATPSVMEAAMRAKPAGDRCKVLAVPSLTDECQLCLDHRLHIDALKLCDGIVCSKAIAAWFRAYEFGSHGADVGKLLVCPGIRARPLNDNGTINRQLVQSYRDGHGIDHIATPSQALRAGADFLVVGRPIWRADDPVAAAKAIIAEMEEAI